MADAPYTNTKQKRRKAWEKAEKNKRAIEKLIPRYPSYSATLANKYLYSIDTSLDTLKDMSDRFERALEQGYTEDEIQLQYPFTKVLVKEDYPDVYLEVEFELKDFPEYLLPYININTYVTPKEDRSTFLYNSKTYSYYEYYYPATYSVYNINIHRIDTKERQDNRYDYLVYVYFRCYGLNETAEKGAKLDRNVSITISQNHFGDANRRLRT